MPLEVSSTLLLRAPFPSGRLTPAPSLSRPAPQDAFFISIIVKAPIVPIISMILGIMLVALDYPAPYLKGTGIHRSFMLRVVGMIFQAFFAVLWYQVCLLISYSHAALLMGCGGCVGDEWCAMVSGSGHVLGPRYSLRGTDAGSKGQ